MLRILLVSTLYYPYHMGGAEISTQLLAEGLASFPDIDLTVLTHGFASSKEVINNVKVIRNCFGIGSYVMLGSCIGQKISFTKRLIGKLSDMKCSDITYNFYQSQIQDYDIIITSGNCFKMNIISLWKCANKNKKTLIHILRDPAMLYAIRQKPSKILLLDTLYQRFFKKSAKLIPYIVAPSKKMILKHEELGFIFNHADVIPNAVENNFCFHIPYSDKENAILYVGAVNTNKGCHTLFKTFLEVAALHPNYKLKIIGKIGDVSIPIHSNIEYLGHLDLKNVYHEMAKSKLVILPSEWEEAFGRVIVESVFNSTIAIGSDRGAIPEIFDYNPHFIFRSGDISELRNKILSFISLSEEEYIRQLTYLNRMFSKYRLDNNINIWKDYLNNTIK